MMIIDDLIEIYGNLKAMESLIITEEQNGVSLEEFELVRADKLKSVRLAIGSTSQLIRLYLDDLELRCAK